MITKNLSRNPENARIRFNIKFFSSTFRFNRVIIDHLKAIKSQIQIHQNRQIVLLNAFFPNRFQFFYVNLF
jgi:hypothetical protein